MDAIVNIRQSQDLPARQRKAWEEFLDMLAERAEAKINSEGEPVCTKLAGSPEGGGNAGQ